MVRKYRRSKFGKSISPVRQARFRKLFLEPLEDRTLLSVFVVNNRSDAAVANALSLRQAVLQANADAAAGISDTVIFDPSLGSSTISLTQGTLELSGAGTGTITIDGGSPSMPVKFAGGASNVLFKIDDGVHAVLANINIANVNNGNGNGGVIFNAGTLTVSHATVTGSSASNGGAIENQGDLTLNNDIFDSNSATTSGGAVDNTGTLTISDCTFTNNDASFGGAIASTSMLTVNNSTFDSNFASNSGGAIDNNAGTLVISRGLFTQNDASFGGAIENYQGTVTLTGVAFSSNTAGTSGGAIDNYLGPLTVTGATLSTNKAFNGYGGGINNNGGTLTVTGTTFSSNSADGFSSTAGQGGGVYSSGTVVATNDTFTLNFAGQNGGGLAVGGGAATLASTTVSGNTSNAGAAGFVNSGGSLSVQNTIISANSGGRDVQGNITSDQGNNLLGTSVSNAAIDPAPGPGDVFNDKPGLSVLGTYGGMTQTLAVIAGSPAIGAGNAGAANLPSTDQRGSPRTTNGSLDIGAFQTQPPALVFGSLSQTGTAGQTMGPFTVQLQDLDGNLVSAGLSYSGNGTTTDAAGSRNLTLVGGAGFAPGQTGQAISLSGANQYAITPNLARLFANGNANVTVSLWFNAAAAGVILDELGQPSLNTGWHDSQIEILADGSLKVRVWNLPAVTVGTASFNTWHNVVLRYNGATQTLDGFLDGVQSTSSVSGGRATPYGSGNGLYYALGATDGNNLGSGAYFKGLIQNINIFNRPLNSTEIQTLYGGGSLDTVTLSSSSSGGRFSFPGGLPISGGPVVLPPGATSLVFDYTDTQPGTPTLTATATGFGTATQPETILPAAITITPSTDIVVGRTLSTYFAGDLQSNRETITFTVYNQQAAPITGVLLTDTLAPGVTLVSASQQPDQNGQNLAWSLGTIPGQYRTSVTITVALANANILQLDNGAQAFAILNAGPISNATPAVTLAQGSVDANLLASTPDANTTDPYVQEEAAALSYNAQNIFNFLHSEIGYNSYPGSLRGARGTLWSAAGNALDVASLGVALMRASGIPAQYLAGNLSSTQAQTLIVSMFPASYQTVGYIPSGTQTADPADDAQLQNETRSHYWFEFDLGGGWINADPLMPGAQVGQTFTPATAAFTEVPQSLRQTTEASLKVEMYSQAAAAFGLDPFQQTIVLDQTFNDVALVGHPLTFGNLVSQSGVSALFTLVTNSYSPYVAIGDDAFPDPGQDQLIMGQPYQEVISNFPLGSQILTGLFLTMTLGGDDLTSQTYTRTMADRIGAAGRQNGASGALAVDPGNAPLISPLDLTTVDVTPGFVSSRILANYENELGILSAELTRFNQQSGGPASAGTTQTDVFSTQETKLMAELLTTVERSQVNLFLSESDLYTHTFAADLKVAAYADRPRLTILQTTAAFDTNDNLSLSFDIDLIRDGLRVVAGPGQSNGGAAALQIEHGLIDTAFETGLFNGVGQQSPSIGAPVSVQTVFALAAQQRIPITVLVPGKVPLLDSFDFSPNAKALITAALAQGNVVIVPSRSVTINGQSRIGWYQVDKPTGQTISVMDNGSHDTNEQAALIKLGTFLWQIAGFPLGVLSGIIVDDVVGKIRHELIKFGLKQTLGEKAAFIAELVFVYNTIRETVEKIAESDPTMIPFYIGLTVGLGISIANEEKGDPPTPTSLALPAGSNPVPQSTAQGTITVSSNLTGTAVAGPSQVSGATVSGALTASWTSTATLGFDVQTISATSATVHDGSGALVGSGALALSVPSPIEAAVIGAGQYQVSGEGSLSFYGQEKTSLSVSGDWSGYSATISGTGSITLTTSGLTLNGQSLPAGTYTITTSGATLSGSGRTSSPNFAGTVTIDASGDTINLGPGSGNIALGGAALDVSNGATLDGYTGTMTVAAGNSSNLDAVTFSGTASHALGFSAIPSLSTSQNGSVSFPVSLSTNLVDTYSLTAQAPAGWNVAIDSQGKVTVTPAPGLQGGIYPIRIIAQSQSDPSLVAQATVNIAITPTQPGIAFAVDPDSTFTVPYQNAQVPSAFQATIDNLGPATDKYNLSYTNIPAGFSVASSSSSVAVPAGQTGIVGIYLIPTAGSTLPAPGTQLSFQVTATSTTDPSITNTATVSFTMPAIDAVSITSNPVAVSALPGQPATITVTLTNVGNVAASAALTFATETGLTVTGLPTSPINIGIGQTIIETFQLTPGSNVLLNSMLQASVTVGATATQDVVSVLSVSSNPTSAPAGQTVEVSADLFAGVFNPRQADISFTVMDASGNTVFSSNATAVNLGALPHTQLVDLGAFSTVGLAAGQYTIDVVVAETSGQPIAGAAGSGAVSIGSSLSAVLTLSADSVDPTNIPIRNTLTLSSQALLGSVQTDSTSTSVAVQGTLAYVVGTKDISIVDISNPASPKILGTFGASDLDGGGLVQAANGKLIVATANAQNANAFKLVIYSLANPQAPVLLGTAAIPYQYPSALAVQGNTVYVSTSGIIYDSGGNVTDQFGDLLTINITNPATPVLGNALYSVKGTPKGGVSIQHGLLPVSSSVAYLVGSSSTGSSTQSGSGRIVIVRTSDPANLSVAGTLDISGTVDAQAIAVDGAHALVVGSTGGLLSPFADPGQIGLTGNVTLTLLDISNPLQPTVVGSTQVTQFTFPNAGQSPLGRVQIVDLGNSHFAISDILSNGHPVILGIDASNSSGLIASKLDVPAPANSLAASGGNVYVMSGNGVQVYQAGALFNLAVTARVDVPSGVTIDPNTFSTAPTQIINGATSETLIWNLTLTPSSNEQITWSSTINNFQPGQVQQVVSGATIQYVNLGTSAQITLPAEAVGELPETQSVIIPVDVVVPGVPAIASAAVAARQIGNTNLANQLNNLSVALTNLAQNPNSAVYLSQSQAALTSIISQVSTDVFLSPFAAGLGAASTELANAATPAEVDTAIENLGTALDSLSQAITDEAAHRFTLSLANQYGIIVPGVPTVFNILIQNTGSATTTYDFSVSGLPAGVTATFNHPSITLAPGQTVNSNNSIMLSLSEPGLTTLVPADFTVMASAEGALEITQGTVGHLTLRNETLQVAAVTAKLPFTLPGGQIDVIAQIESIVNEPRQLTVSYTVTDAVGNVLFTSSPVMTTANVTPVLTTLDLGAFDTTGFSDGVDTITVTVADQSSRPLSSATGQGNVTIGLPVTASLSVSPSTLPTGTSTITNTLTINPAAAGGGVLSFLGQVTDNGTPTAVAVDDTLAYVPTSTGIDIVDVSDPSNPVVAGTFGLNDVTQGGYNRTKITGNLLIVLSEQNGINANHFNFIVYSLTDPRNPQLLSNTPFTIAYTNDVDVDGNAAFISSNVGFYGFGSGLFAQSGDFTSVDLSNPSAPVLGSKLSSDDQASPPINSTFEEGTVVVNSQVAYVTGSTSTGGPPAGQTVTAGVGRLLVVNIQDPKHMTEYTLPDGQAGGATELDVPGTVYLFGVAIEGNYALVAGSSEGIDKDGNAPGNLTLTVLNISDPLNPQIVKTVSTSNTIASTIRVQELGNHQFAVTGTALNGGPVLEVVNIIDPSNPSFGSVQVPDTLNGGITAAAGKLYLTSTTGLTIFNIGQLTLTPVTASVEVPSGTGVSIVANSFNIQPTQIVTGTDFTTLEWDLTLAATTTITWRSTVSNLAANQVVPVTLGATVDFTSQGVNGTETVAGTSVTAVSIISVTPVSQTAQPGATAAYDLRLINPTGTPITYFISVNQNNDQFSQVTINSGNSTVTVGANQTVDVPLVITVSPFASAGDESFTVVASQTGTSNGALGSAAGDLVVAGPAVITVQPNAYGVVATLTPAAAAAGPGTSAHYVLQVTNTGSTNESFLLAVNGLPNGVSASFSQNAFQVQPGASNFRQTTLTLAVPAGTAAGSYPFTVTVSASDRTSSTTTAATLNVAASGVSVSLTPSSGAPGSTFQLTIENTGTITDTFNLTLGGPAALVATLGTTSVTLAPGQSQQVPITTTAVSFANAGPLPLVAIVTSQTNSAVVNSATASLDIPTRMGINAEFSPASQTLLQIGPTTFLLLVHNIGNLQDLYTATITGTTGPIAANLVGLDGQPTQTVPIFILPGLSTGAIELQTSSGQGSVNVQITSMSNPAVTATATATVNVTNAATITISGEVFFDYNSNGVLNAVDKGLAGRTVYIDLHNSGVFQNGDPSTVTAADGSFTFTGLTPGTYTVREETTYDNVALTSPVSQMVNATGNVSGINFGNVLYNPAFPINPAANLYGSQSNADTATAYVIGLYQAILSRSPGTRELASWVTAIQGGMAYPAVANQFVNSREHRLDEVNYYYENFLGRSADSASAAWVDDLVKGVGETAVIEAIMTSQEYTAKYSSDAAFVNDLYFHLLGRHADSGGAAYWEQKLAGGTSRAEVVAGFLNSQESVELATESFYAAFLHRMQDQPGAEHWVGQFTSGALNFDQIAAAFFSVPPQEFLTNAAKTVSGTP